MPSLVPVSSVLFRIWIGLAHDTGRWIYSANFIRLKRASPVSPFPRTTIEIINAIKSKRGTEHLLDPNGIPACAQALR